MKSIKYILSWSLAAVVLSSCSGYLDPFDYSLISKDKAFSLSSYIASMPLSAYSTLPGSFTNLHSASDEAEEVDDMSSIQRFNVGNWSKYSNPDNRWDDSYKGIRIACDYLRETDTLTWEAIRYSDPVSYNTRMKALQMGRAEMRFIRAYLYFELFKRYGEVPLITTKINVNNADVKNFKRAPLKDIIAFICDECDIVSQRGKYKLTEYQKEIMKQNNRGILPLPYRDFLELAYPTEGTEASYLGRATAASAIALKAKVLTYYASVLFNPDNETSRWEDAAEACNEVIKLTTTSTSYGLENKYADIFQKKNQWSKEFLFVKKRAAFSDYESVNYPISIEGGQTGACPSQNQVDAYEMTNGELFDWNNATHRANPYQGRDPRLRMTVFVNGDVYSAVTPNNITLECWTGGNSAAPIRFATKTGYYLKKYINPNLNLKLGQKDTKTWIYMRMTDFYLFYAEAMNEAYGPSADPKGYGMTALAAINRIRSRADVAMPPITTTDKYEFKRRLINERRVELAFEESRFWDVKRWMLGQNFNSELRGVQIENNAGTMIYTPKIVEKRVFDEAKMYLYPIPQSEINNSNGVLTQNPNW